MSFGVNRGILIAGIVTVIVATLNQVWVQGKTGGIVKIQVGAYVVLLILSIVDLIPGAQRVTTALAMLTMLVVLITQGPALLGKFTGIQGSTFQGAFNPSNHPTTTPPTSQPGA